ncbi:MAG: shikimate dehydrogenase [Phascolarctobacterium sp.]|uniref:shikimate dehydrogenase n=1 Tax=Phascolarctobacterium sp. TaxID=2049039 RepID=UPI0026DB96CC|nr:shikimate dehydrogenase [Phascolarctobacterium sp.]MDO4921642.1 shikimate dehydrogenase [Phascolarctobacterium sp.]
MEKLYGLLGGKLGHSLSPQIHRLFFAYTGRSGQYNLLETELETLPQRMQELRRAYAGCNVTIPHKLHVMPLLDKIAPEAAAIGAVNTIKFTGDGAWGYNTDYFGFGRMLDYNEIEAAGRTAAVLGTGGAARAVVKYLADQGVGRLYLVTRDVSKADAHFLEIAPMAQFVDYQTVRALQGDLLVNCTPVGMYPKMEAAPVGAEISAAFSASVDLIYNPAQTLFLRQAQAAGRKAVNGLFMLVAQAVAAQEIWQGERYDSGLIVRIMRELEQTL